MDVHVSDYWKEVRWGRTSSYGQVQSLANSLPKKQHEAGQNWQSNLLSALKIDEMNIRIWERFVLKQMLNFCLPRSVWL